MPVTAEIAASTLFERAQLGIRSRIQDQVGGAAGDRQNPGGGRDDEHEAQSSNVIGSIK